MVIRGSVADGLIAAGSALSGLPSSAATNLPLVSFVGPWSDVSEGAGFIERTLKLSAPSDQVVTVVVQPSSYRAGDMDVAAQTVTFQPGQTTATFRVAVYEDALYEGDEIFGLELVSANNAVIDLSSTTSWQSLGYIKDNDAPSAPVTARVDVVGPIR